MDKITQVKQHLDHQGNPDGWSVEHDTNAHSFVPLHARHAAIVKAWLAKAGNTLTPAVTVAEAQRAKTVELERAYAAANAAPISFTTAAGTTATFTMTAEAKADLHDAITSYAAAGKVPSGFSWIAADGKTAVPFTLADLKGLAAALGDRGWTNRQNLRAKLGQVQAANTVTAVNAITF